MSNANELTPQLPCIIIRRRREGEQGYRISKGNFLREESRSRMAAHRVNLITDGEWAKEAACHWPLNHQETLLRNKHYFKHPLVIVQLSFIQGKEWMFHLILYQPACSQFPTSWSYICSFQLVKEWMGAELVCVSGWGSLSVWGVSGWDEAGPVWGLSSWGVEC